MLKGCLQMGFIPDLEATLNLVPADYVSKAIVHLSKNNDPNGHAYQVINPNSVSWDQFINWLIKAGYPIQRISYDAWYKNLVSMGTDKTENELFPLISLFSNKKFIQKSLGAFYFDSADISKELFDSKISCPPISEEFLRTHFGLCVQNNCLNSSNIENLIDDSILQKTY
jgi:thioester reductase-like protein